MCRIQGRKLYSGACLNTDYALKPWHMAARPLTRVCDLLRLQVNTIMRTMRTLRQPLMHRDANIT